MKKFTFSSDSNYEKSKKKKEGKYEGKKRSAKRKYVKKNRSESNKNELNLTNATLGKNINLLSHPLVNRHINEC